MRKILYLLVLTALFVSCSSDDDNTDPNNGNGNNNGMFDEKILGKWKVEYSKTIKPAVFNKTTGKVEYDEKEARIAEYDGNYNGQSKPASGMFHNWEYSINIKKDNKIYVYQAGDTPDNKDIVYKIENNILVIGGYWDGVNNTGIYIPKQYHKYNLNNNTLTIEFIGVEDGYTWEPLYKISKYSKITE